MKNKGKKHQKQIMWILFGIIYIVACTSCVGASAPAETLVNTETLANIEMQLDDKENNAPIEEDLPTNTIIHVDDTLNSNMAGMLQEIVKGTIVQIQMNQVSGSGVIWRQEEEKLVIVTAAHVLAEDSGFVQITFADGYEVESVEYSIETSSDVAFVYVPMEKIAQAHMSQYCLVNVNKDKYDEIQNGDIVIVCGSVSEPGGDAYEGTLIENWIWVEDFNQYMMLAKMVAEAGMSGGAVFDEEGYFLGILCGVNENDEAAILPLIIIESAYLEQVQ